MQFVRALDPAVAGEDLLDQRGAGAGQPDDEDRRGLDGRGGVLLQEFRGEHFDEPIVRVLGIDRVVGLGAPPGDVALFEMMKRIVEVPACLGGETERVVELRP